MPAKKTATLKAKPAPKVVKKVVKAAVKSKPKAKVLKVVKKVNTNDSCCGGDSCCGDGGSCCSEKGKYTNLLATVLVVLIFAVVAYFAYVNYQMKKTAPFEIEENNGVTTVTPGAGLTPDGPPTVVPPTVLPPTN